MTKAMHVLQETYQRPNKFQQLLIPDDKSSFPNSSRKTLMLNHSIIFKHIYILMKQQRRPKLEEDA